MKQLLKEFFKWANKTPQEYAQHGMNQNLGEFEEDFPGFYVLTDKAKQAIDENVTDEDVLCDVLTVMALDNESEGILEYICDESSEQQVQTLVAQGLTHPCYHTRWLLALLLSRRKPHGFEQDLRKLAQDKHPYVRMRAKEEISCLATGYPNWDEALTPVLSHAVLSYCASSTAPPCVLCGTRIGEHGVTDGYLTPNGAHFICRTCAIDEQYEFLWELEDLSKP